MNIDTSIVIDLSNIEKGAHSAMAENARLHDETPPPATLLDMKLFLQYILYQATGILGNGITPVVKRVVVCGSRYQLSEVTVMTPALEAMCLCLWGVKPAIDLEPGARMDDRVAGAITKAAKNFPGGLVLLATGDGKVNEKEEYVSGVWH